MADLVIGSGGTVCRESALRGIPTISTFFCDHIMKYLIENRFPIEIISPKEERFVQCVKNILREPDKFRKDTSRELRKMESPIPIVVKCVKDCISSRNGI